MTSRKAARKAREKKEGWLEFTGDFSFQNDRPHCPCCSSPSFDLIDSEFIRCSDCHHTYSLPDTPKRSRQMAWLFFQKAQKERNYPGFPAMIRKDLHTARKLLMPLVEQEPEDAEVQRLLGLIYFLLAHLCDESGQTSESLNAIKLLEQALKHLFLSHQNSWDSVHFIEGLALDRMAVILTNSGKPESALNQRSKAVECFESFLAKPKGRLKKDQREKALFLLVQEYWRLAQAYKEKGLIRKAINAQRGVYFRLQDLKELRKACPKEVDTGLVIIEHDLASSMELLPQLEKNPLENEWILYLEGAGQYYRTLDKKTRLQFLTWLDLVPYWKAERMLKEPYIYTLSALMEDPAEIKWEKLRFEEQMAKKEQMLKQFVHSLDQALSHLEKEEGQRLAQEILLFLLELEKKHDLDIFYNDAGTFAFHAGSLFARHGYSTSAIDLIELALHFFDQEMAFHPDDEFGSLAKEFKIRTSYQLALFHPSDKRFKELINTACRLINSFEDGHDFLFPELIGEILMMEMIILTEQKEERAGQIKDQIIALFGMEGYLKLLRDFDQKWTQK